MSEYREHISELPSEQYRMSALVEAQTLVRVIAEPRAVGDSVKTSISKSARRLGFTFSRAKDIWYGDARRIDAHEIDRLREVAGRHEAELVRKNLVDAHARLASTDPDGNRKVIDALECALGHMGCEVRPVAVREV